MPRLSAIAQDLVIPSHRDSRGDFTARKPECEGSGNQIERHGDCECASQSEHREQEKTGRECSGNRASRIDPVEAGKARSKLGRTVATEFRARGLSEESRPSKMSARKGTSAAPDKTQRREESPPLRSRVRIRSDVNSPDSRKSRERNRGRCRDPKLNPCIERDGSSGTFAPGTNPRAAGCESRHEYSENSGNRIGRVAEDQAKRLAPYDLIDQSCSARQKKANEKNLDPEEIGAEDSFEAWQAAW